jgi:excisionase family DNA binding protein
MIARMMRVRPAPELLSELPVELTTQQVAAVLGISPSQVRQYITRARTLPARRCGPTWRVKRADLEDFLKDWQPGHAAGWRRGHEGPDAVWIALHALASLGEATAAEIALAIERHEGNVRKYLGILRCRDFVTTTDSGVYTTTAAGRDHLAELKGLPQAS